MKLLVIMDPLSAIVPKKDTSFAIMLEAQRRQWPICYCQMRDMYLDKDVKALVSPIISLVDRDEHYYALEKPFTASLKDFDVVLMRKDPPFDMDYVYATYLLELAERQGARVFNKPQSLRDANEKMFAQWFADYCPKTLVTANMALLGKFLQQEHEIVCKPLGGMGGDSIFRVKEDDTNRHVIFETLTGYGHRYIMAQAFIPEVLVSGDKRIFMINGNPVPYSLARIPASGDFRANLVKGGKGVAMPLTSQEKLLCDAIGPALREKGLVFVGLDVINGLLTEINVTSPTGVRQIESHYGIAICSLLLNALSL